MFDTEEQYHKIKLAVSIDRYRILGIRSQSHHERPIIPIDRQHTILDDLSIEHRYLFMTLFPAQPFIPLPFNRLCAELWRKTCIRQLRSQRDKDEQNLKVAEQNTQALMTLFGKQ
jgi:hypothetical protein